MHRRVVRFVFTQKNFMSRSSAADHHEMILYNEKSHKSNSLIISVDNGDNKEILTADELKTIRNDHSRILFLFNANLIVLYKYAPEKSIPTLEEQAEDDIPVIGFTDLLRWFAKSKDSDVKSPIPPGGRIGRLDAANEAGFFHRTDRSRLKEIKNKLKNKGDDDSAEEKKDK